MPAKVFSAATLGLESTLVEVEVDIGRSLPNILLVGLPDAAVQEAKERVRAAIKNSGLRFPATRVTVNLAPGDVRKEGPMYDLPVAVAVLLAADELKASPEFLQQSMFVGELALNGLVRPVSGVLSAAILARNLKFTSIIVPQANAAEAALVDGINVIGAASLIDVVRHCLGEVVIEATPPTKWSTAVSGEGLVDFSYIQGQELAKRALEIAAAGGHNVRMSGPPGSGKTLLARALTTILPPLTKAELLEVTRIYSTAGLLGSWPYVATRPFRSPHHTTSHVALVGGGTVPRPGEISLAHRGVLFLDEFPEFPRHVLEALRQPLEDGVVNVSRAAGTSTFPARFTLVTAENPCPCGYSTDTTRECICTPNQIATYKRKISGPLLDRIDLHVPVPRLSIGELSHDRAGELSAVVRERVVAARSRQTKRFQDTPVMTNAEMSSADVRRIVAFDTRAKALMEAAIDRLRLSARAYYRTLKIARTIADLGANDSVRESDIAEALQFRGGEG